MRDRHVGSKRIPKKKLVTGLWIIGFGFLAQQVFMEASIP